MTTSLYILIGAIPSSDSGMVGSAFIKTVEVDLTDSNESVYSKIVGALQPLADITAADFAKRVMQHANPSQ